MPIRVKTRLARRRKLLYEIGVGIVLLTVLLGVLSTVTMAVSTPIVTTQDLLNTTITFALMNTTDPASGGIYPSYNLSDISTLYDNYLYISVPSQPGYEVLRAISLKLPISFEEATEYGVNKICVTLEPINTTNITVIGDFPVIAKITGDDASDAPGWYGDTAIVSLPDPPWMNGTCVTIDPATIAFLATAKGVSKDNMYLYVSFGDVVGVDGLKLRVTIYGISKRPVLAIYAEPVYAALTAVVSALYAAARRIQQHALSAFSGLGLATLFSGLTGSAVLAMVLGIAFFVIMVELRKKR